MNKLFTKIVGAFLGLTMAVGVGVAVASKSDVKSASATVGDWSWSGTSAPSGFTTGENKSNTINGLAFTTTVTYSASGWALSSNNGKTTASFTTSAYTYHVNSIQIDWVNNSGKSVTWNAKVGDSTVQSQQVTGNTGGTITFDNWTDDDGTIQIYTTSPSGGYKITGLRINAKASSSKTVTGLEVLDGEANELADGDEINVSGSGESATAEVTCEVTYSSGDPDGLVDITSEPSSGFSVDTDDDSTYTMTFTANGDYDVTIAASLDDGVAITVTYHVSGIVAVVYQKVTSTANLKAGSEFIIGKADGTYVMSKYSSGNNCASLSVTPTDADNIPASAIPSGYAIFTLSGSSTGWTLTDQDNKIYYGTSGQNYLKSSTTATDTWTISISGGVATITSAASSRSIKKNQSSALFSTYASGQHDISIYMIPSNDPAIEVAVTGSTSLAVGGTATLTASKVNGATGTISWSKNNNHVTLSATTGDSITVTGATDGSTEVTASLTGGSTVDPVVTTFTVTKALSSIAVTTAPTKTTYTEGESFDNTGMVVTATYDDASTETPSDYTWSPTGALTPSDTSITISWGGKSTTQSITVNAKVVSGIAVQSGPTKNSYHAGDEFVSTGLTIRVTYEGGSTADITSGFTISPDSYTFTSADETAGSKTFTVTYSGKSTTFSVTVAGVTGPIASGRYYIMTSDKAYGLNAAASKTASPAVVDLASDNELTAFDITLMADNQYEISTTIDNTKYYLVANTPTTSSNNNKLRITDEPDENLYSLYWSLYTTVTQKVDNVDTDFTIDVAGAYFARENTVENTTNRYLSMYNNQDWRGYNNVYNTNNQAYNGDPQIQFVPEGSYADAIVDSLNDDLTCDNGAHAPSTSVWSDISDAYGEITIQHEKDLLKNADYTKSGSGTDTVVVAEPGTSQDMAEAVAKYDYVVGLYNKTKGITAYNDFLGREPSPVGNSRIILGSVLNNETNTIAVIVVISLISMTAVGGYFFIKRRKEN